LLDSLGKALEGGGKSPLTLLHGRRRSLEERLRGGERVFGDEVKAFHSLVTGTLRDFRESEERHVRRRAELLARVEVVLDSALKVRELAVDPVLRGEVEPVLNELRLLPATDRLSASRLDALETHLGSVKQRAESALEELAARRVLEESVIRHLGEFGYEVLEDFGATSLQEPGRARLRVPGGEQVWVTLQVNGALGFRLVHEDRVGVVSVVEHFLPEFRRQEEKWCADLKRLFSCLAGDGFPYEIRFERTVPEGGVKAVSIAEGEVPVVYWEFADEWEEAEGRQERRALE
jgi:hypothetical protein